MLALIVFMIFLTSLIFFQGIFNAMFASQVRVRTRINSLDEAIPSWELRDEEVSGSLSSRLFGPMLEGFGKTIIKYSSKTKRDNVEAMLRRAGKLEKTSVGKWYTKKLVMVIVIPLILLVVLVITGTSVLQAIAQAGLFIVIINLMMSMGLKRSIGKRQKNITNNLPDALDLITVSVEAGLSFDGAVDRVIRQMPTALSEELAIALKEMRMGKTRREALRSLSDRCLVDDLTTLVGALIQADELGVGIGRVLRIQSKQIREKRRQRAREKAMKAPIKLLFPLIFFIFPTIFVILIGPAGIQIVDVFMK